MRDFRWQRILFVALAGVTLLLIACSGPSGNRATVRRVDRFQEDMIEGAPTEVRQTESLALLDFAPEAVAGNPSNLGWKAGVGGTAGPISILKW